MKEIMTDSEKAKNHSLPCTSFLLTSSTENGDMQQFVVTESEGETIEISEDGYFIQTFKWAGHKASKEEIENFIKAEDI